MGGNVSQVASVKTTSRVFAPLFHSFSWMLIGNSAIAASQWGIVVMLARFSGPETLGAYVLGLSIAGVMFGLTNLELRTLQVTDHSQQASFDTYYVLRVSTGIAGMTGLTALALFQPYSNMAALAIVAVGLSKCLDGLSDVIYGRLQARGVMSPIGRSQFAKAIVSLLLLGLALAISPNPVVAIGVTIVPYAAVLLFYDISNLRTHGDTSVPQMQAIRSASPRRMALIARAGLPLTIVNTLVVLHPSLPRLVLGNQAGEAQVGVLAALSYIAIAPNLLAIALGQASMKPLAHSIAIGDRRGYLNGIFRMLIMAGAIGAVSVIAGLGFGGDILTIFYGHRFGGHDREFVLLLGAGAINYLNTAVGYSLSSARVFGLQIPMITAVCLISLITSVWLIPQWHVVGAAASQMISQLVLLVWSSILLWRTVAIRFDRQPSVGRAAVVSEVTV